MSAPLTHHVYNTYSNRIPSLADVDISVVMDCCPGSMVIVEALSLASASLELEDKCRAAIENGTYRFRLPAADWKPFHLFLRWMEKREVDADDQTLLALAWNFGGEFGLTDFQNDLMRKLFHCFESDILDPAAVAAAWAEGLQGSLLQRALSNRLAYNFAGRNNDPWSVSEMSQHGLHKNLAFLSDFAIALCSDSRNPNTNYRVPVPRVDNFLISD